MHKELSYLKARDEKGKHVNEIIGEFPKIRAVRSQISLIAALESADECVTPTILIVGETGTGKELVARALAPSRGAESQEHRGALAEASQPATIKLFRKQRPLNRPLKLNEGWQGVRRGRRRGDPSCEYAFGSSFGLSETLRCLYRGSR